MLLARTTVAAMLVNPLSQAPADTPVVVVETSAVLAVYVFPGLFLLICLAMLVSRTKRAPYFSYLCALAAPGCLGLCVATANSPLSALAFFVAFPTCPLLSAINARRLYPLRNVSFWHRGARWAALSSIVFVLFFVGWTVFDSLLPRATL